MSLMGKRVVVFDGYSEIGKTTAKSAVSSGAYTYIVGRDGAKLEAAKEEIFQDLAGGPSFSEVSSRIEIVRVDVTSEEAVRDFFGRYPNGFFNHLVLTAGATNECDSILGQEGFRKLKEQYEMKFFAQLAAVSYGAEKLADEGSITLTSGSLGKRPGKRGAALGNVNAALDNIVKGLANDLGPRLRINSVSPGLTDSEVFHGMPKDARVAMFAGFGKTIPVGHAGKPEDVAHAIQFLMENSFVTGTTIDIDGGANIRP